MGCSCRKSKAGKDDEQTNSKDVSDKGKKIFDAREMFSIEEAVQIFYIDSGGTVSSPSHPSDLYIVKLPLGKKTTFIYVNDWVYPLIPRSSPVLKTCYGAYIFPNLLSDNYDGSSVGLIFSENLTQKSKQQFEHIITKFANLRVEPEPMIKNDFSPPEKGSDVDTATYISKGITKATDWIAWGIGKAAMGTNNVIQEGSEQVKKNTAPSQNKDMIDPSVRDGLVQAKYATGGTVQISGHLVERLSKSSKRLSKSQRSTGDSGDRHRQLKEYQNKASKFVSHADTAADKAADNLQGTKLEGTANVFKKKVMPNVKTAHDIAVKPNKQGKSKVDGVIQVAASGLEGMDKIGASMESAAFLLGNSLAKETVSLIQHKYGSGAASVAENSFQVGRNVVTTAMNVKKLGCSTTTTEIINKAGKAVIRNVNQLNM